MKEREFRDQEQSGRHPSACTCVACTRRRLHKLETGGNPIKKVLDFLSVGADNAPPMNDTVIQTRDLTKTYGSIIAVNKLSMDVPRGRIFGLLGPNGSGKTTTLSILLGLTSQTSGNFSLFEDGAAHTDALHRIGAIVETPAFYPYLSGRNNLAYFQAISGKPDRQELDRLLDTVGLGTRANDKFHTYSLGMKQRLGLAYALLGDPRSSYWMSPPTAWTPAGMAEIRDLIRRLGTGGRTVLLSSHLLHEVEAVCDSVAILAKGKLIAQGDVSELLGAGAQIQFRTTDDAKAKEVISSIDWVKGVEEEEGYLLANAPTERSGELTAALSGAGVYVTEMRPRAKTLEQYFLEVTGGSDGELT